MYFVFYFEFFFELIQIIQKNYNVYVLLGIFKIYKILIILIIILAKILKKNFWLNNVKIRKINSKEIFICFNDFLFDANKSRLQIFSIWHVDQINFWNGSLEFLHLRCLIAYSLLHVIRAIFEFITNLSRNLITNKLNIFILNLAKHYLFIIW